MSVRTKQEEEKRNIYGYSISCSLCSIAFLNKILFPNTKGVFPLTNNWRIANNSSLYLLYSAYIYLLCHLHCAPFSIRKLVLIITRLRKPTMLSGPIREDRRKDVNNSISLVPTHSLLKISIARQITRDVALLCRDEYYKGTKILQYNTQ